MTDEEARKRLEWVWGFVARADKWPDPESGDAAVLRRAADALRVKGLLVEALEEIGRVRDEVLPSTHQYDNNDIEAVKRDRDALRQFRFWLGTRLSSALAEARKAP